MGEIARVKTGIPGFDELIQGGIPKGFNVLLVGQPGTGKTIFGMQYLVNGAKAGENGIYVSLDSPNDRVRDQARQFGWDIDGLEKEGKITLLKVPLDKPKINLFDILEEEIKETKAVRLVFDSLADFAISIDQFATPLAYTGLTPIFDEEQQKAMLDKEYRYEVMPTMGQDPKGRIFYKGHSEKRITYLVMNELLKLGTTNLIITDSTQGGGALTVDGVSEYSADGVVVMSIEQIAREAVRSIRVQKMRNTEIKLDSFLLSFSVNGLSVKEENIFKGSKISGINP